MPVDADLKSSADLTFATFEVQHILQAMEREDRVSLVILDARRDNPFARSLGRAPGTRSGSAGRGLAPISIPSSLGLAGRASGTLVAFATQPDNIAEDGRERNSPFTTALLRHIRTPGLEIETLMRRVRTDVFTATNGKQIPRHDSGIVGGDVVLASSKAASALPSGRH